jgi:polyhydroxyalkanoate synthesis regulator phasin
MILVMNKRVTLDALASMVQAGFLDLAARIDGVSVDLKALTLRVDMLEQRLGSLEKRMDMLEERVENGFYNITQELQQIRNKIAEVVTRKEFYALEARVDVLEKKLF